MLAHKEDLQGVRPKALRYSNQSTYSILTYTEGLQRVKPISFPCSSPYALQDSSSKQKSAISDTKNRFGAQTFIFRRTLARREDLQCVM